jgi:hypothetical protein
MLYLACESVLGTWYNRWVVERGHYDDAMKEAYKTVRTKMNPDMSALSPTADQVLKGKPAVCRHIAGALISLAMTIGVPKSRLYEYHYMFDARKDKRHAVVLYIRDNGSWYVYDPTWGLEGPAGGTDWFMDPSNQCGGINIQSQYLAMKSCHDTNYFCPWKASSTSCWARMPIGDMPGGECT